MFLLFSYFMLNIILFMIIFMFQAEAKVSINARFILSYSIQIQTFTVAFKKHHYNKRKWVTSHFDPISLWSKIIKYIILVQKHCKLFNCVSIFTVINYILQ
jgi:hypothetical protein